jgi:site-specific DNA-methyltransferase (adenine-specific)
MSKFETLCAALPKPYYKDGSCALYHADFRNLLHFIPAQMVDLVATDPPYGISLSDHGSNGIGHRGQPSQYPKEHYQVKGDDSTELGEAVLRWAAYFKLPVAVFASPDRPWPGKWRSRLVWDKGPAVGGGGDTAKCFKRTRELVQVARNGDLRERAEGILRFWITPQDSRLHICAKPVALMKYLIWQLAPAGGVVFDPFAGSGSTLRAAKDVGCFAVGFEIEEKHCRTAAERLTQEVFAL